MIDDRITRRTEAIVSALLVLTLPLAVSIQMSVGGALGIDPGNPHRGIGEWLREAIWAASFFSPFVVGALLGVHAARRLPSIGWRVLAWAGIVGNLGVIGLAVLFIAGEATNPH